MEATRSGDHVHLRWTTPSRTTDDMDVKSAMTAQICREAGPRQTTPVARAAACAPVQRLAVTPGPSEVDDTLPPALLAEPVVLLTYRIQIFNAGGHSAGDSAGAYAAAGPAPPAVESLRATASEQGAVLEWRAAASGGSAGAANFVEIWRSDLSPPALARKQESGQALKPAHTEKTHPEAPEPVHLRAAESATASPGTIDATAAMGHTYSYRAERVRRVTAGGQSLEIRSFTSPAVTLAMQDTFPPKSPIGLATISGFAPAAAAHAETEPDAYIDLSWEPNSEPDLAGYRVYRQLARPDGSPQGPLARLTALPVTAPSYRDVAVKPGQGYIYTVTAVDAAGNESAPSTKALEVVPEIASPETRESPH